MWRRTQIVSTLTVRSDYSIKTYALLCAVSNPPPSPVTDSNRENSSDFDTNDIQHMVNVTSPEKSMIRTTFDDERNVAGHNNSVANGYEDDFLDVNCDDMDLF